MRDWASVYEHPEPVLELSTRDLSEIKALKQPPVPVKMLMEVCCLLFQIRPATSFDARLLDGFRKAFGADFKRFARDFKRFRCAFGSERRSS